VLLTESGRLAFTAFRLQMEIIAVSATIEMRLFVVIETNFLPLARGT